MVEALANFFDNLMQHPNIPLFIMRGVLGFVFIYAARNKLSDVAGFAKHNKMPEWAAYSLITFELFGGLGVMFGIYTQVAALILLVLMGVSIYLHVFKWESPYWASEGGWEYDLLLFSMALVILATGGGEIGILTGV